MWKDSSMVFMAYPPAPKALCRTCFGACQRGTPSASAALGESWLKQIWKSGKCIWHWRLPTKSLGGSRTRFLTCDVRCSFQITRGSNPQPLGSPNDTPQISFLFQLRNGEIRIWDRPAPQGGNQHSSTRSPSFKLILPSKMFISGWTSSTTATTSTATTARTAAATTTTTIAPFTSEACKARAKPAKQGLFEKWKKSKSTSPGRHCITHQLR